MKKQTTFRKTIEKVWKNRAAIVIAIAATVFMCGLTALEFVALRMEWNLPVLAYVTGDSDSYIFEEYRSDEMKLDESTENVMLEEDMLQGESQSENSGKDITQGESQSEDDIVPGEGKNENVRQEDTVQGENQQEKDSQQSASDEAEFPYYIKVNRRQNCITVYTSDENGEYTVPYKADLFHRIVQCNTARHISFINQISVAGTVRKSIWSVCNPDHRRRFVSFGSILQKI